MAATTDPRFSGGLAASDRSRGLEHEAFCAWPGRDRPGALHVKPKAGFMGWLRTHWRAAGAVERHGVGPLRFADLAAPDWPSWRALEGRLQQGLPTSPGADVRLEASLVLDPETFRKGAQPPCYRWPSLDLFAAPAPAQVEDLSKVRIRFKQSGMGWLGLMLSTHRCSHRLSLSMVYDPLEDIIRWLDECLRGELPALLGIDQEGHDGFLVLWSGGDPAHGILQVLEGPQEAPRLQVRVHCRLFVARFLQALRGLLQGLDLKEWCMDIHALNNFASWEGVAQDIPFDVAAKAYQRWLLNHLGVRE